ncbi:MAG: hypothetical protein IT515_18235 [Burkholderiales bacterium]|nr:hypothetical protein [Burkholderiales bacterium]
MLFDVRIVTVADFLRTDLKGNLDVEPSRRALAEVIRGCAGRPRHHVLIDWRQVGGATLSLSDLFELAADLDVPEVTSDQKIASLHPSTDELNLGRYFEVFTAAHGFEFQPFTDPAAALAWLGR